MKQQLQLGACLAIAIFLSSCASEDAPFVPPTINSLIVDTGLSSVQISLMGVADTEAEHLRGLQGVASLKEKEGMLFIFNHEKILNFWMKDALIPLDILFIDEDLKVVDFARMPVCQKDPCPTFRSKKPAKYALEVPAGSIDGWEVRVGDEMVVE